LEFLNETKLAAAMFRGEPEPGQMLVTVVAKAAYAIEASRLKPLDATACEILVQDKETPLGVIPSDQVPLKEGVDVFVMGHAHPLGGNPQTRMEVSFALGAAQRRLLIVGDREWRDTTTYTPPRPFTSMPITYKTAFGGTALMQGMPVPFPNNSLGKGFVVEREHVAGTSLPNVETYDAPVASWQDQPTPAGFAAFPADTRIRAERSFRTIDARAGTYEFLPALFSSAHPQMIFPKVESGTECSLKGMSPEGVLRFSVPRFDPVLTIRIDRNEKRLPMRMDTMCVLTEERRVFLSARASCRYRFVPEQVREARMTWDGA